MATPSIKTRFTIRNLKLRRFLLLRTKFIGITGSVGKTSTKDFLNILLSNYFSGTASRHSFNTNIEAKRLLLETGFSHRFSIHELGAWGKGTIHRGIAIARPNIAIVTTIKNDHYSKFRGLENTYQEKVKLVESLNSKGVAILNRDDPWVYDMRKSCKGRVVTYGTHPDSDYRATKVNSAWPNRLSFTLSCKRGEWQIETRLVGEAVLYSILPALATILEMRLPVTRAISAASLLEPGFRRMSVHHREDNVTFVRDDFKGSMDTAESVCNFIKDAAASRKIIVFGKLGDYRGAESPKIRKLAREIAPYVNKAIFINERAHKYLRNVVLEHENVLAFRNVKSASEYLLKYLKSGDLVCLKAGTKSHVERLIFNTEESPVKCWIENCKKATSCEKCRYLFSNNLQKPRKVINVL